MTKRASTLRTLQGQLGEVGRGGLRASLGWSASWWQVLRAGALVLVLALSPSTWNAATRRALARHLYLGTAPVLAWFALISALISVVLIRIVVITALSYGLSQYALEMVIRMLVLELIPLGAALFVALQVTLPSGAALIRLQAAGALEAQVKAGLDPLRHELMPRVLAGIFAVALLAAVSGLIAMLLSYAAVYGFTFAAFPGFTRTMGKIFIPAVTLIFALKTLLFGLAVALIPVAAFLRGPRPGAAGAGLELQNLVRLFAAILMVEALSLAGNYA